LNLWKSKNKQLENTGTTGRNKRLDTGCKQNCGQTDEILHERPKLSISLNLFSHLKNELAIVKVRVKVSDYFRARYWISYFAKTGPEADFEV
jgi:hypothetical protein